MGFIGHPPSGDATELPSNRVELRTAGRFGHGSGGAITVRVYVAWVANADWEAARLPSPAAAPAVGPTRP